MKVEEQIAIIYCGTKGLVNSVPVKHINDFQESFIRVMHEKKEDVLTELRKGKYTEDVTKAIEEIALEVSKQFL